MFQNLPGDEFQSLKGVAEMNQKSQTQQTAVQGSTLSPNDKLKWTKLVGKQGLSQLHLPFDVVPIPKLDVHAEKTFRGSFLH